MRAGAASLRKSSDEGGGRRSTRMESGDQENAHTAARRAHACKLGDLNSDEATPPHRAHLPAACAAVI